MDRDFAELYWPELSLWAVHLAPPYVSNVNYILSIQVRVFGFGANQRGDWDHYFERTPKAFKTGGHGGSFEYLTIKELDQRQRVEMYRGL